MPMIDRQSPPDGGTHRRRQQPNETRPARIVERARP